MAYNPQDGSLSAKPYAPSQGVPTDARSYYYDSALYKWRPYQSTAEVLAYLDTATKRTGHFPVFVHSGTLESDGTFTGGSITEYWFKDGVADASLVVKTYNASSLPDDVDVEVTASGSAINGVVDGVDTFVFPAFIGYKVRVSRNYQLIGTTDRGTGFYTYDSTTATFIVAPDPVAGETFQIQAYKQ